MVSLPGRGRAAGLVDSYWSTLPARSAFPPGGSRPWVGLVDVPVPGHVEKPASVLTWLQPEPGDHPLTALVIAVEQVNGHGFLRGDGLLGGGILGIGRITERALPEAV